MSQNSEITDTPVSYTHLDVYKRQIVGHEDDGTVAKAAIVLTGTEKTPSSAYLNSYGGSILGTFGSVMNSPTIAINWNNDHMDGSNTNTYSKIFGTTKMCIRDRHMPVKTPL